MNFKLWLEGLEEYEPYRSKIDAAAYGRDFAFKYMFRDADSNGRIYIPFENSDEIKEKNDFIKELSEELEEFGYEIVDIKQGYARKKGTTNTFRIGKLLATLNYKENKKLEELLKSNQISKILYDKRVSYNNKKYNDLKTGFENLPSRIGGEFEIVISKNPHDVGSMSTGRGWESCMNLETGAHRKDVYCEVSKGGFIAYLIKTNDKNIERPIARIHIRRFDNKKGESIALPEESVYGNDVAGFLDKVKEWLVSKQGVVASGPYRRIGGKYSDTYGSKKGYFMPPDPKDKNKIMNWITKWMNLDKEKKAKYNQYFIQSLVSLFKSQEKYPSKFLIKLKEFIFGENYIPIKGEFSQHVGQFRSKFALVFPEYIDKEDFKKSIDSSLDTERFSYRGMRTILLDLIDKFPQFVDEEILIAIKNASKYTRQDVQEKLSSKFSPQIQSMLEDEVNNKLKTDNPRFVVNDMNSIWEVKTNIYDEIDKLLMFKPIPERLITKLLGFINNIDKLKLGNGTGTGSVWAGSLPTSSDISKAKNDILRHSISVLSRTKTDTPSVQRFYQSLLPRWEEAGGIGVLGWAISCLEENGKQFLPFLIKKRNEIEKKEPKTSAERPSTKYEEDSKKNALEYFDHVIDTLQTGKRSTKYDFNHGATFDSN